MKKGLAILIILGVLAAWGSVVSAADHGVIDLKAVGSKVAATHPGNSAIRPMADHGVIEY